MSAPYVGARFTAWWLPRGTQMFVPPQTLLTLADFDATGLTLVRYMGTPLLALIEAEVSGDELFDQPNSQGSLLDGSLRYSASGAVNRMRNQSSGDQLLLNGGTDSFNSHFGTGQMFADPVAHVQTEAGRTNIPLDAVGGGFIRFDDGDDAAIMPAIATGDRFILAISYTPMMTRGFGPGFGPGFG